MTCWVSLEQLALAVLGRLVPAMCQPLNGKGLCLLSLHDNGAVVVFSFSGLLSFIG